MHAIDMLCPINWLDPLNRGLVALYQCLPGITGGRRFVDLTSPGPMGRHGTLVAINPSTDWKGTSRQGGFRELDFVGLPSYVDIPDNDVIDNALTGSYTIMVWTRYTTQTSMRLLGKGSTSAFILVNYTGGASTLNFYQVYTSDPDALVSLKPPNLADGSWHHIAIQRDVTTQKIYIDGKLNTSRTETSAPAANAASFRLGLDSFNTNVPFIGQADDLRIYARAPSAEEMRQIYLDSLAYSPRTLRRIGRDETYTQEELEIIEFHRRGILLGGRMNNDRGILTGGRL